MLEGVFSQICFDYLMCKLGDVPVRFVSSNDKASVVQSGIVISVLPP